VRPGWCSEPLTSRERGLLTPFQLIPQIWTNWRTKKTEGLPALMMFLWALCECAVDAQEPSPSSVVPGLTSGCTAGGLPFGVYAVVQNFNIPLQVQPQIFMALCLIAWAQILLYHR
jgi:hypothetical protein